MSYISNNVILDSYKIAIVGEAGVGKSSIVERIVRDRFISHTNSTVGAAFSTYKQHYDSNDDTKEINYQIWDTAGQERYKALIPMYLRNAHIIFVVYDVTNEKSVERMKNHWYEFVYKNSNKIKESEDDKDYIVVMIGNKYDLHDDEKYKNIIESNVRNSDDLCNMYTNICHLQVSAKTGVNIEKILETTKNFILSYEARKHGYATDDEDDDSNGNVIRITKAYWDNYLQKRNENDDGYGCYDKCVI